MPIEGNEHLVDGSREDLLWRHLKTVPAFRALLRSVEARFYQQIHIPEPVLDLGCGDGHFARMAFEQQVKAGVDPWWRPLREARRRESYHLNVQALGNALPFAGGSFASVVSNSVLEHIEDVQPVISETNRVLQPGGLLVITVPSHLFIEYLGGARLLGPIGLDDAYRRFFNFISRHAHTNRPEIWAERLAQAGFRILRWQYYFSRGALRTLELGHVQGLPSAVLHFLTGHWIIAPWQENLRLTERWVRPYYEEETGEEGAYLLFVAQKQGRQPLAVHLPDADPLPMEEPEIGSEPTYRTGASSPLPSASTGFGKEHLPSAPTTPAEVGPTERGQSSHRGIGAGTLSLGLLMLGFLLALFGQSLLGGQPQSPAGGLLLFALSWLALGGAAVYASWRRERDAQASSISWPQRRYLLLPALLSVVLAQSTAGDSPFQGRPLPVLLLWMAGLALAWLALDDERNGGEHRQHTPFQEGGAEEPSGASFWSGLWRRLALPSALFLLALLIRLVLLTEHPFVLNGIEASIGLDALAVLRGQISNPFATAWLTNPTLPLYFRAVPIAIFGRSVLGARILSALLGALTVPVLYVFASRIWDRRLALPAALLLAGYHLHVHYSRLGMNNVWDPLVTVLALGSLALARQQNTRRAWLLTGILVGTCAYFYMPSHLLPFILLGAALYLLFLDRPFVARNWPHLLSAVSMAALVSLPQYIYYEANPGLFMERARALSILHTDWLVQEASASGRSPLAIVVNHFWQAALAFNASLDRSTTYNPGIPLLRFWPSVFFVVGLGVAVARLRQFRYAIVLLWLGVTVVFAGALLVDTPDSHRLLIATPAVVLLATLGVSWFVAQIVRAVGAINGAIRGSRQELPILSIVTLVVVFFIVGDLLFYFGPYRRANRFGDRNTEAAHEIAEYLNTLEGRWTAYFHGAPAMYVSFPTIPFLASDFAPQANLFDVEDPAEALPASGATENLTFIYLPERSEEVNLAARRFPDGQFRTFNGRLANPLFYTFEVEQ